MKEGIIFDLEEFIEQAKERQPKYHKEQYDRVTYRNYEKFSDLEEYTDYYKQIRVCKAILSDIKNSTPFVYKMEQYCPGVTKLSITDISKIRFNPEQESYIIYANGHKYEIYEGDIRFIYPSIMDVPDSFEYEAVIEDSSVYVYHRFTNELPFKVYGLAEAVEE
ncbi:MAG: hypothetical protein PVF58_21435 [Candidatus Methanofastidiosia archaeon]|jgi:hypothetical protein